MNKMSDNRVAAGAIMIWEWICMQERRDRRHWIHPYNRRREEENTLENFILELRSDKEKFYDFTRLTPESFDYLLGILQNRLTKKDTNYRRCLSAEARLFITLRFLATGATFAAMHFEFRVGATTISHVVSETCEIIWEILQPIYMKSEYSTAEWEAIAKRFESLWNFPHCVGCIDGKHIRIKKPANCGSQYYNYKGFHSIVLQAVVDADGNFLFVDIGDYGRASDSGVFCQSHFGKKLLNNELSLPEPCPLQNGDNTDFPFVFLADEAYRLHKNIMRPFSRRSLTSDDFRIYNYRHSRARRIVECAFGILRARFRIFSTEIGVDLDKIDSIVMASCVLHNFIKKKQRSNLDNQIMEEAFPTESSAFTSTNSQRPSYEAMKVRENFKNYFISEKGSVSWQYTSINK